jgi:hypothetical protein
MISGIVSSANIIDVTNGSPVSTFRFSAIQEAIQYLSTARLVCCACGATFDHSSPRRIVGRGNRWEVSFPHDCSILTRRKS